MHRAILGAAVGDGIEELEELRRAQDGVRDAAWTRLARRYPLPAMRSVPTTDKAT
jgi:hypothetical protein